MKISKTKKWLGFGLLSMLLILYAMKSTSSFLTSELENSVPRKYAIKKATNHTEVLNAIGNAITVKRDATKAKNEGTFSLSFGTSSGFNFKQNEIDTKIQLEGKKGTATLVVKAKNIASKWEYNQLYIIINSTGEKIDLL